MPAEPVERRVVTVLFADLVGFTALAEHLDPEDVSEIQDQYFTRARDAVCTRRGTVEKFIGDAVCAVFGLAGEVEDAPVRAVEAGLAIVSEIAALTEAVPSAALRVRVGITTGEVVIRYGEPERVTWRLTGDVVNLAARLQGAAEPGTVLLDASTALGVEGYVTLESRGTVDLKGKSAPVPVWRALRVGTASPRLPRAPFVGRADEMAALTAALAGDDRQRWLVEAPPGVGKSRLVEEFALAAHRRGHPVYEARVGAGDGSGYAAVASLLRDALGLVEQGRDPSEQELAGAGAGPRERLAARHTRWLLSGHRLDEEPEALFASWLAVLDGAAGEGPAAVWILEDVHLARRHLLAFLDHAAAHGRRRLVLVTARPSAQARELATGSHVLPLAPISPGGIRALVVRLVGEDSLPEPALELVVDTAAGNPLYAEELLRFWVLAGALIADDRGGWRYVDRERPEVLPPTVHAVYLRQLASLHPSDRDVLDAGAVPGRTFPSRAVPVLGVADYATALRRLATEDLLAGPHADLFGPRCFTFRHALLRDVAYAALPRAERAARHERFARWLEHSGPGDEVTSRRTRAELVATHLAAAHDNTSLVDPGGRRRSLSAEAAQWFEVAARDAVVGAPSAAAALLARALALTPADDTALRLRRRLARAESLRRAGEVGPAMVGYAEAADDAREPESLTEAALGYEDVLLHSRLSRAEWGLRGLDLLQDALERTTDRPVLHARLLAGLGQAQVYAGRVGDGTATCAAALRAARAVGDRIAVARALLALRSTQTGPAELVPRLRGAREVVAAAHAAGDVDLELEGTRLAMVDLVALGDLDSAWEARRRAEDLIAELERPSHLWYPPMWAAMEALLEARPDAETVVDEFGAQGRRWGYRDAAEVHAVQRLHLRAERGGVDDLLPELPGLRARVPHRWAPLAAYAYAIADRREEAAVELRACAADGFALLPHDMSRLHLTSVCALAASELGAQDVAGELVTLLRPWAGRVVVLGSGAVCLGAAGHFAGVAARTAGDLVGAAGLLRAAIELNDAIGARAWAVRSRNELGRTLRVLGRPEASRWAAEARGRARALGLHSLLEEVATEPGGT